MITYEEALNSIAERTIENRKEIRQKNLQRRTGMIDNYGVEIPKVMRNGKVVFYSPSISTDKEYFERLQFKLVIENAGSFDQSDLRIKIGDTDDYYYDEDEENPIPDLDISEYLASQQGVWATGDGIYPTDIISDRADAADFYDILEAVGDYLAENDTAKGRATADMILSAGLKRITVTINGVKEADISLIIYVKYSHINR